MSLEQEIKQDKFENEFHKAAVNILFTSSWLYNAQSARLKSYGITPEQFNVLRILRGSHPKAMMLAEITGRMIDKSSNATRLVEKLRLKGLAKREICENNRRQVDIMITSKGLELLARVDQDQDSWKAMFKSLSKADAQEMNRLLDKMRAHPDFATLHRGRP